MADAVTPPVRKRYRQLRYKRFKKRYNSKSTDKPNHISLFRRIQGSPISKTKSLTRWKRNKPIQSAKDTDDDIDLQIISAPKSNKCPLTLCTMTNPVKSVKCNHTFEQTAIRKLLSESAKKCQKCTFINENVTAACRLCQDPMSEPQIKCPVLGCNKDINNCDLTPDLDIMAQIKRCETEGNGKNVSNESDSDSENDDDYIKILNSQRKEEFISENEVSESDWLLSEDSEDFDSSESDDEIFFGKLTDVEEEDEVNESSESGSERCYQNDSDSDIEILNPI